MRIVYLNPCGKFGGAETSLRELLASVRRAEPGWPLALVLGEDGPLAETAREIGVEVIVRPFPPALSRMGDQAGGALPALAAMLSAFPAAASYARSLAALLRELQPDLVHTNGLKMHLLGAWAKPRRTPLVWHIHDYVSTRRLMSRLLRVSQKKCALAIANSKSVARDLEALLPGVPVRPVYNSVDLARFSPSGSRLDLDQLCALPQASPETIRVGLVGTFAKWKGQQVFLEALASLRGKAPVRGYIIGDAIYQTAGSQWSKAELQREADRLGLGDSLGFTGFVADTAAAMRALDIVVHASTQPEPFGMVIIEAMACGKAVIASRAGGAAELFVDGENALAHAPGDASALAGQIARLASDSELRKRLGAKARKAAERLCDPRRLGSEVVEVYETVCSRPRSAGRPAAASREPELAASRRSRIS